MLLEQQISPKNPIFFTPSSTRLRPVGFARRGDHPPHPPVDPSPGRASTDNLGYFRVCAPNVAHVATGGKKWLKKPKSERNDIELVSFHYWTRLDKLIILVWSNVKNG